MSGSKAAAARLAATVTAVSVLLAALSTAGGAALLGAVDRLGDVVEVEAPDLEAASRLPASRPTVVLAADGTTIATFRPEQLHVPLGADDVPEVAALAVVAAEDGSFWEHPGFDVTGTARAVLRNAQAGTVAEGGSTITQQLVKNLFTDGNRTLARKFRELRLALAIERDYSKAEILAAYLNTTYIGEGAIGLGAASRTYFRKPVAELSLSEAALLAGIVPAPSRYNPRAAPELAEARRQYVLDRLAESGLRPPAEIDEARRHLPTVHPPTPTEARFPYFVDYVRRWLLDVRGVDARRVFHGGLRVETTLDPRLQAEARAVVAARLPAPDDPAAAVVVIDPTGAVRALVGGRDWEESQVNLALGRLGGGTGRQPGSSFKPIVLAAALRDGASPTDRIGAPAEYQPAGASEPVHNYARRGYGRVTLQEATWRSINTSYVLLAEAVGPGRVAELARELGLNLPPPGRVGPSIGVGAYETSPLGMARAYAVFANDGRRVVTSPVQRVLDGSGRVLFDRATAGVAAHPISTAVARTVTATLTGVVEHGTGTRAGLDRPVAGKTGTSDDYADAWFVGYTPQLVGAVWMGHPEGTIPMTEVEGVATVTGGTLPAEIWRDVMAVAHQGVPPTPFPPPPEPPQPPTTTTTGPDPTAMAAAPRATATTTAAPPPAPAPPAPPAPPTTTTTVRPEASAPPAPTTTASVPSSTTTTVPSAPSTTTTAPPPATTTTTSPPATTTTTHPPPPTTTTTSSTATTAPATTTPTTAPPASS